MSITCASVWVGGYLYYITVSVCVRTFISLHVCVYILYPSVFILTLTKHQPTALASDNVNEDKPVSFVVKQPGSFNLKMHLGRGGGWRLKPSPSYGASQRVRWMRHWVGRWARERKVGTIAGLNWFDYLCVFFLIGASHWLFDFGEFLILRHYS